MEHIDTSYVAAFGVGVTVVLLLALMALQRVFHPGYGMAKVFHDPGAASNPARRFMQVGQVLAVFLLGGAVVRNCVTGESLEHDLVWATLFGGLGLLMIQLVGGLGLRMLFRSALTAELERGNVAAGLAAGANYAATGILVSRAAAGGDLAGLGLATFFLALAVATHAVFVALFRALTTYDDEDQIKGENLAAAISYSGVSVAVALIVARGVEGDFQGMEASLKGFAGVVTCALGLYPVRQLLVQGVLLGKAPVLRGGALDQAIGVERQEAMAALEATTYIAAALTIAGLA